MKGVKSICHVNPTWVFSVFPENLRKRSSFYSQVRAVKPASVHSGLGILMSRCMWGLSSSSPECLGADMVSQNQAQLRQIMRISSAKQCGADSTVRSCSCLLNAEN